MGRLDLRRNQLSDEGGEGGEGRKRSVGDGGAVLQHSVIRGGAQAVSAQTTEITIQGTKTDF